MSNNNIDYEHSKNIHLSDGPSEIVPIIIENYQPKSVLDVGCGLGIWLNFIIKEGIVDCMGIDGIDIDDRAIMFSKEKFQCQDLTKPWKLQRRFDLALCLEVAEHLHADFADCLIHCLTNHADLVIFSAACPHQDGQGHINCQWPAYWQEIFNKYQYVCSDDIRPLIWDINFPEYWYKQNIFVARRDPKSSGKEARIMPLVHPDMYESCYQKYLKLLNSHKAIFSKKDMMTMFRVWRKKLISLKLCIKSIF